MEAILVAVRLLDAACNVQNQVEDFGADIGDGGFTGGDMTGRDINEVEPLLFHLVAAAHLDDGSHIQTIRRAAASHEDLQADAGGHLRGAADDIGSRRCGEDQAVLGGLFRRGEDFDKGAGAALGDGAHCFLDDVCQTAFLVARSGVCVAVNAALGAGASSTETADIPVAYEELLISLPASHPLAGQERICLKDLQDTPFVLQGPRHSIRILADQLFREAGFQPVVAFESDDVLLVDSMMHQAVGVGLVSKAHVFPCEELVYLPLDPPVRQTLHLRYPLGHTLTEPEYYLAGLLAEERLADPRYQPADDPFVAQLLDNVRAPSAAAKDKSTAHGTVGTALQTVQDVNLDTKVMEYLIAIVEEQSLSKAADRFFLAQPALSRHLRSVEAMVGMPLFSREHNRLRPTSAGTIFVNNARNILRIETEMFAHTKSYDSGRGGHLYISCDPLFAEILHKKVEPAFHRLHPDLTLVFTEQNQEQTLEALGNSSADLGVFLSTERSHPLLNCDVLDLTEMVYCFAAGHLPEGWLPGDPLPKNLTAQPQLLAKHGSTLRREQDAIFSEVFSHTPDSACEAVFSILRKLANLGIADCIMPLNMLERTQHFRCAAFDPPKPLYLLLGSHVGRTLPAVTQELSPLIRDALADVLELLAKR